jgi:hypothetical protein
LSSPPPPQAARSAARPSAALEDRWEADVMVSSQVEAMGRAAGGRGDLACPM